MSKRNPTKGWGKAAPRTKAEKQRVAKKCGVSKAFLLPKERKFPIVSKRATSCRPDCRALLAAKQRADQYGYASVAKKAQRLAVQAKCPWA